MSELLKYPTTSRLDRIAGALLGLHAGDLLGTGDANEGTDLTRAVLLGYLDPGGDVVRAAAGHLLAWFSSDPNASGLGQGPAGNGSLMRCLPTALAVSDAARRVRESMELSALTHPDPRCTGACAAYNEIVAALVAGQSSIQAVAIGLSIANAHGGALVVQAVRLGTTMSLPAGVAEYETGMAGHSAGPGGEVLHSLSLAVGAVLDPRSLEEVLIDVVRVSGDSDTDAAIAGGLLGARDGAGQIPERWTAKLRFAPEFIAAAATIAAWR
ncbi:MAG TPA: ADP-ribosylglycohydrolase family protein [Kineosporiaceae bacterium]|nr:ADP-ribosylglycohydrolase family protein [Kineosporiaceae bacterium]